MGGRRLLLGFALGVVVTLLAVGLGALTLAHRGIGLSVDLEPLAASVREEVRAQAAEALPELIEEAKRAVPGEVAAEVRGKVGGASLQIADVTLTFPPALTEALEARVVTIVEAVVNEVFDQMDTEAAADELAGQAEQMVRERFAVAGAGTTVDVKLLPWLTVPVMLTGK